MARTRGPIRRLTAAELGIEDLLADEQESAPQEARTPRGRIPKQMDAPIITAITDHRLVETSGRAIELASAKAEMIQYLAGQFRLVVSDLEGNADKRTVAAF